MAGNDVDTEAMKKASGDFAGHAKTLKTLSDDSATFQFHCGDTFYKAEGDGYQGAVTTFMSDRLPPMQAKADTIGTSLGQSKYNYLTADETGAVGFSSAAPA